MCQCAGQKATGDYRVSGYDDSRTFDLAGVRVLEVGAVRVFFGTHFLNGLGGIALFGTVRIAFIAFLN